MRWFASWLLSCVLLQAQTTVVHLAWDTVNDAGVVRYFVYVANGGSTPATNANYYLRQAVIPVASTNTQSTYVTVNNGATTFWVTSAYSNIESIPSTQLDATIPVVTTAPVCSLTALPTPIYRGQNTTLSWTVSDGAALGASIDPGVGAVNTVWNSIGTNTCTALVDVNYLAPTFTFTRSPTTVLVGEGSTLAWSTMTDATSASITPTVGSVSTNGGSTVVYPVVTTTYTNTAVGPGGSTAKTATVSVSPALGADFTASPVGIFPGYSSTLSWTTYGTCTAVSIDNGIGAQACGTGSVVVSPTATTDYLMTISGTGGPIYRSVTVRVTNPVPPTPVPTSPTVAITAMKKAILIR
jgi:hypothetical protein